jgi:predicted ArsR family transcriptional regulator
MTDGIKRPRGRPRPQETIERDARILEYLTRNGPQTRNHLAEVFHIAPTVTYLSLDRLRQQGQVQLCDAQGGPDALWTTQVDAPCPASHG